jgi:enolase
LVGDEGGYGPKLTNNRDAVAIVAQAIEEAGLIPGEQVALTLDVAATHFYRDGMYHLQAAGGRVLTTAEMIDMLEEWVEAFPIISIEDGLAEEDWEGWQQLNARLGDRIMIVGDDLFTTNAKRVKKGIQCGAANSVLVKVNQIGTISETIETMAVARGAGMKLVVSARSGETEDDTLADFATAAAGDQIKIGSIVRSERLAKYNQLLRLAETVPSFGDDDRSS